jgi:uncharacterized protein YecE (DUF72 family)
MLHVGTSGFAYDDWRGRWYPPDLPRAHFFDYYAERFNAVEINSTFYHLYSPRMMDSLVRRAAGRVLFAVKMSEWVTHHGMLTRPVVLSYAAGIEPALRAGVLAAVLLQFPQRFHFTPDNRRYLERALSAFPGLPLVVEIRHDSWQTPAAWRFFHDSRINLCLMDMPRLSGLPAPSFTLTGDMAYIRFHGRNAYQWHRGEYPGARYDYFYSDSELESWVEPASQMQCKATTALAFFNNHVHAQAPQDAETFMGFMGQKIRTPSYQDLFADAV